MVHSQKTSAKNLFRQALSNAYLPLIPIHIWNLVLISKLPPVYHPDSFNSSIPAAILIGENLFRSIIFVLPLFCRLQKPLSLNKGLVTFSLGSLLYFASWLMVIYATDSAWSKSIWGFTAPAYTPVIWLVGLGLMIDSYYFKLTYSRWHIIAPALLFIVFHLSHTIYVYYRIL